jgi:hypothetical protein
VTAQRVKILDEAVHNPLQFAEFLTVAAQLRDCIELVEKQHARRPGREIKKGTDVFRGTSQERRDQAVKACNV